jgi:3-oxoacyl-[acyl-carrier protein] reductase
VTGCLVVTGAAQGIGEAIARAAAAVGYRVGLLDVDPAVRELAAELPDALAAVTSCTDPEGVEAFLDVIGPVDVAVNNAGIVRFGPLFDQQLAD